MRQNGSLDRVICVCHDRETLTKLNSLQIENLIAIPLDDVEAHFIELKNAKADRSPLEYFYCLTPYLVDYANQKFHAEVIAYVDADIYFFKNPDLAVLELSEECDIGIVPHRFEEKDRYLEKYGIFNVGMILYRESLESVAVMDWWKEKCIESTSLKVTAESFGDQKYLNQFPKMSEKVFVINNQGHNAAPWNCYNVILDESKNLLLNNFAIIYFHFSGLRRFHFFTRMGYAGYSRRPTRTIRKHIYQQYLRALKSAENDCKITIKENLKSLSIKEWLREIYYLDLIH